MKLKQPGQVKVWIWRCGECGKDIMAPGILNTCKAYCPICHSTDIAPEKVLIWLAGQPKNLLKIVNFLRYGGGA